MSGTLVIAIGLWLLYGRFRALALERAHDREHEREHALEHERAHAAGLAHAPSPRMSPSTRIDTMTR